MNHQNSFYQAFVNSIANYSRGKVLTRDLWIEIDSAYSSGERHYHNLKHLQDVFLELQNIRENIVDWDVVIFSIAYHDIVYEVLRNDNEEKSAEIAEKGLAPFLDNRLVQKCKTIILSTKAHLMTNDSDTNYFTDADLSVLGSNPESYHIYAKNIRKENFTFPDVIYKSGRRKVIEYFLKMERIYKTGWFFNKCEAAARENLTSELSILLE